MSDADKKHLARARFETFPDATHPKFMYHRTKPPVQVFSQKEIDELGSEWSEVYIHQEYPTVRHHWIKQEKLVKNADEDAALGPGWGPKDAFAPYRGARSGGNDRHDPVKWVDSWRVPGLSPECRNKIKAQMLRADGAFWRAPDSASADLSAMNLAFDGVARVLFEAGILTKSRLENEIPTLIWDSAIACGWYRFASETPERIFPERLGHYHVWRDESQVRTGLFRVETAEWLARLLEVSPELVSATQANDQPTSPVLQSEVSDELVDIGASDGSPTTEGADLAGTPEDRLSRFMQKHPGTTYADIKFSANVHTAEFQDWRRGKLKSDSVMSERIEDVLSGATLLKKKPHKSRGD
jgi:hypothetical protein